MRQVLLFLVLLCLSLSGAAQSYYYYFYENANRNPRELNNDLEKPYNADPDWDVVLTGSATQAWSAPQDIPFTFQFNGAPVTQYRVSSTGVLTFDVGNAGDVPPAQNAELPSAAIPNNSICVWGLQSKSPSDIIASKTYGVIPNRQHWISFRAYEYPEGAVPIADVYWSIVLEELTNRIYIVDQKDAPFPGWDASLTLGVQVDANTAVQVDGSPNISNLADGNSDSPNNNSYYSFQFGQKPMHDAELVNFGPRQALTLAEAPVDVEATVINLGDMPLSSLKMYYSIDGQAAEAHHFDNLGTGGQLTHRIPWLPTAPGTYELRVWVDLPNGMMDPTPDNNSRTIQIEVLGDAPDRLSLIESFTAHNCGPCAFNNPILDAVVDNNYPAVAHLKFVTVFLGQTDPRRLFNPADNATRVDYYGINAIPTAVVNGTTQKNSGAINNGDVTGGDALAGEVAIDIDESINGANIDFTVDFTPLNQVHAGQNIVAHVGFVQNELYYNSPTGSNGEKDYFYTMRYMIPDGFGTALPFNGTTTTVTGTRAINPIFEGSLMHTVAYVQNNTTREILMATKSPGMYFCDNGSVISVDDLLVDNVSCQTASNGRIELQLSGGGAPYNVTWSGTAATGTTVENLGPGQYTATITDQAGCTFEVPTRVQIGGGVNVEIEADMVSCNGDANGRLEAITQDGTYTYAWSNGNTSAEILDVAPGTYSVTVTDNGGCTATDEITITEPAVLEGTAAQTQSDPSGNGEGEATVTVTGGAAPYTYAWNTTPAQTEATATGLAAGSYEVTVTDFNGCTITETVDITSVGIQADWANVGLQSWQVSPNPAVGQVQVSLQLERPQDMALQLFDQQGRLLRTQQMDAAQRYSETWDLSDLSAGIYSLQVVTEQGRAAQRLILR